MITLGYTALHYEYSSIRRGNYIAFFRRSSRLRATGNPNKFCTENSSTIDFGHRDGKNEALEVTGGVQYPLGTNEDYNNLWN